VINKFRLQSLKIIYTLGILTNEKLLVWLVRVSVAYLFFGWIFLYLSFGANVEVEPLGLAAYRKAILLGILPHSILWMATMRVARAYRWWLLIPLLGMLFFYVILLFDKVMFVSVVGGFAHFIAFWILFKGKFRFFSHLHMDAFL